MVNEPSINLYYRSPCGVYPLVLWQWTIHRFLRRCPSQVGLMIPKSIPRYNAYTFPAVLIVSLNISHFLINILRLIPIMAVKYPISVKYDGWHRMCHRSQEPSTTLALGFACLCWIECSGGWLRQGPPGRPGRPGRPG